jgi:quercetin dioxygenase-like cupin family protein
VAGSVHAWRDIPTELAFDGITRQTVHGDRQTVVRYVYAPGSVFPVHAHAEEQVTVVLTGRIVFEVGGNRVELGPGELAVIPPYVPHGAKVEGTETVETINMLSPRRTASPFTQKPGGRTVDRG